MAQTKIEITKDDLIKELCYLLYYEMHRVLIALKIICVTDNSKRIYYDEPGTDSPLKTPKELAEEYEERIYYVLKRAGRLNKKIKRNVSHA